MLRLNSGQEDLTTCEQSSRFLLLARGCRTGLTESRDELMNLLSRNMVQVEVFILQIKFPSLYLPVSVTSRRIRFM
jgi:hypothetical protein